MEKPTVEQPKAKSFEEMTDEEVAVAMAERKAKKEAEAAEKLAAEKAATENAVAEQAETIGTEQAVETAPATEIPTPALQELARDAETSEAEANEEAAKVLARIQAMPTSTDQPGVGTEGIVRQSLVHESLVAEPVAEQAMAEKPMTESQVVSGVSTLLDYLEGGPTGSVMLALERSGSYPQFRKVLEKIPNASRDNLGRLTDFLDGKRQIGSWERSLVQSLDEGLEKFFEQADMTKDVARAQKVGVPNEVIKNMILMNAQKTGTDAKAVIESLGL